MNISFRHESNRNTKCYSVRVGGLECFISYETVIAFRYPGMRLRRHNDWGRTTGRHMKEMCAHDWPEVDERTFERELDQAFAKMMRDEVARVLANVPAGELEETPA